MAQIDHLIYTAPSLEEGMDHIASILGIRPVPGGQHPQWGTQNALLSLGDAYLEIVAPDPSSLLPAANTWIAPILSDLPRLATWSIRTNHIDQLYQKAKVSKIPLGGLEKGQRTTAIGQSLSWKLSDPSVMPFDGLLPFLIDWGTTPHPSQSSQSAGRLHELRMTHPEAKSINPMLKTLGIDQVVIEKKEVSFSAIIQCHGRYIELS